MFGDSMSTPPSLLTTKDLARLLQVSTRTLRRWQRGGHVPPPLRIGGSLRWRAADIETWLSSNCLNDSSASLICPVILED